jgi:hypothetical protein
MTELRTAHTADLGAAEKAAIRGLMDAVFDGVSDDTFDNALGGVHALILSGGELIGHGSVVQRRMLHAGRAMRTGYIEGVAVRVAARCQRRQVTGHQPGRVIGVHDVVQAAYEGKLSVPPSQWSCTRAGCAKSAPTSSSVMPRSCPFRAGTASRAGPAGARPWSPAG